MRLKKGQVTIFVLIGILVLLIVGFIFVANKMTVEQGIEESTQQTVAKAKEPLEEYIDVCLQSVVENGLLTIGLQGGYYSVPLNRFTTIYTDVPYYYDDGDVSLVPSMDDVEDSLSQYITNNLMNCLGGFETFREMGYTIETGLMVVDTSIMEDSVSVVLDYPVTLKSETEVKPYEMFVYQYDINLNTVYSVMNTLMTDVITNPYYSPLSLMLELGQEHGFQIDTLTYENSRVFVIQDLETQIQGVPFIYLFATKTSGENIMPVIEMDEIVANVGEEFNGEVSAFDREGDVMMYSVEINDIGLAVNPYSGEIEFIPDTIGEYTVMIFVSDGVDEASKEVTVRVV